VLIGQLPFYRFDSTLLLSSSDFNLHLQDNLIFNPPISGGITILLLLCAFAADRAANLVADLELAGWKFLLTPPRPNSNLSRVETDPSARHEPGRILVKIPPPV
jgi:hypothetical protein